MNEQKPDYLGECMSDVPGVPIDEFNQTWCVRCPNSSCARSASNGHLFVHRAENWKDMFFNQVRRAADDDPAFDHVRAKSFISPPGPADVRPSPVFPGIAAPSRFHGAVPEEEEQEEEQEETGPDTDPNPDLGADPEPDLIPKRPDPPPPSPPAAAQVNTPFSQGTVLPGAARETVIQSGQTYTLDDE